MDPKSLLHFVLRRSSSIISCMLLGFSRKNSLFVPLNLDGHHRFSAEKMEAGCNNVITMPSFHAISDSIFRSVLPECARPEIEEDSSTHGPSDGQIPLIGLIFAITSYFFGTKGAFEVGLNPAFLGAIVAGYISIISLLSLVLSRLVLLPTGNNIMSRKYYDVSTIKICKTSLDQLLKDAAVISTASMTSLFTSGQVLSRPCDPSMQNCGHMKGSQYLSADQWATVFLGFLLIQLSVKGCSRVALFISLAISISTINLSLVLVESQSIYLINKIFMCVVIISFEIQRTAQQSSSEIRMPTNGNCSRDATTWTANESMQELDLTSNAVLELEATINNSAHDLKSPCTALGLGIESLMKNLAHQRDAHHDVLTAQNFEVVKGMYQTLMFMNMSINRSMDYAKSACGISMDPTMSPLNIFECIRKITQFVTWEGCADCTTIEIHPASTDFYVDCLTDVAWFQENVSCLLRNAVKFSSGSVSIEMRMVTVNLCRFAEISVTDSGSLSITQLDHLFDAPVQAKRGHVGGMGLGLACLAERVKVLGGDYGARARNDGKSGTVIWFGIPFVPVSSLAQGQAQDQNLPFYDRQSIEVPDISKLINRSLSATNTHGDASIVSGLSILLVDDAITILKMASYLLTKAGAKVTVAKNGLEAVEQTKLAVFDVIITDIQMPVLDGFEASKMIRDAERASGSSPKTIIGISASSRQTYGDMAKSHGMDAFLLKPFRLKDLVDTLVSLKAN